MVYLQRTDSGHENKVVTVFVVEDEAVMRTKLAEELEDAGYSVVEASDGSEAVDILTLRPDVTIIISDVKMPGPIDGVELYRRIRSGYPGIKVVLSSGEPNAADLAAHDGFFCEAVPSRVDDQAYQVVHGLRNAPDSIAQWSQASSTKASQRSSGRS